MSNVIETKFSDGKIQSIDFDLCLDETTKVLDDLLEKEGVIEGFDFGCCCFHLFHQSILVLKHYSWTEGELRKELSGGFPPKH